MTAVDRNAPLDSILMCWFPGGADAVSSRLLDGDFNDVYRVEKDGEVYALRVYTRTSTRRMIMEEQQVVRLLAERLPEVLPPIATAAGDFCVERDGRVAALSRFAFGERPERSVVYRNAAAELLARVHRTSAELDICVIRNMYPRIQDLNWLSNRWWRWEDTERYLRRASRDDTGGIELSEILDRLKAALDEIPRAVGKLGELGLPLVQVHGDYYPGNMKARRGRITALFDWDETRVEWRAWEVGRSIWEFCKTDKGVLDVAAAGDFMDAYCAAGGSILQRETHAFVLLMRADILWGVSYSLGQAQRAVDAERGLGTEWDYDSAQLSAMNTLREASLE